MVGLVHALVFVIFFVTTPVLVRTLSGGCTKDSDCEKGSYCLSDKSCDVCIKCEQVYNRHPGELKCAKYDDDCGNCLPGHQADSSYNQRHSMKCYPMNNLLQTSSVQPAILSDNSQTSSTQTKITQISFAAVLAFCVILFIIIWLKKDCLKRIWSGFWSKATNKATNEKNEKMDVERQIMNPSAPLKDGGQSANGKMNSADDSSRRNAVTLASEVESRVNSKCPRIVIDDVAPEAKEASSSRNDGTTAESPVIVHRSADDDDPSEIPPHVVRNNSVSLCRHKQNVQPGNDLNCSRRRVRRYSQSRNRRQRTQSTTSSASLAASSIPSSISRDLYGESLLTDNLDSDSDYSSSEKSFSTIKDENEETLLNKPVTTQPVQSPTDTFLPLLAERTIESDSGIDEQPLKGDEEFITFQFQLAIGLELKGQTHS